MRTIPKKLPTLYIYCEEYSFNKDNLKCQITDLVGNWNPSHKNMVNKKVPWVLH